MVTKINKGVLILMTNQDPKSLAPIAVKILIVFSLKTIRLQRIAGNSFK